MQDISVPAVGCELCGDGSGEHRRARGRHKEEAIGARVDELPLARLVPERAREAVTDHDPLAIAELPILGTERTQPSRQVRLIGIRQLRIADVHAARVELLDEPALPVAARPAVAQAVQDQDAGAHETASTRRRNDRLSTRMQPDSLARAKFCRASMSSASRCR
jgi:hypothetical protein